MVRFKHVQAEGRKNCAIRLGEEYSRSFRHNCLPLNSNTFFSGGVECKALQIMRRKSSVARVAAISVLIHEGDGKMFVNECEWVIADPDKPKLCEDYEVFYPFVVALPFLLGQCSFHNLNLGIRESTLPSPAFFVSQGDSHDGTIVFCHNVNKLSADGWVYVTITFKGIVISFCFPMIWFALLFGISPLKPQTDPCTLLTSLTEEKLELCRMCSEISITQRKVAK